MHARHHFLAEDSPTAAALNTAGTVPRLPITAGAVVRFAAGAMVLLIAGLALVQFGWLLWATTRLDRAARAAVEEAALPRATRQSVESQVRRALADTRLGAVVQQVAITINDRRDRAGPIDRAAPHDVVAVRLSVPARAAVPDWLGPLGLSLKQSSIRVRRAKTLP
jgi:Flp pilus assembly protein TadG